MHKLTEVIHFNFYSENNNTIEGTVPRYLPVGTYGTYIPTYLMIGTVPYNVGIGTSFAKVLVS